MAAVLRHSGDCILTHSLDGDLNINETLDGEFGRYTQVGTYDYEGLINQPAINGNILIGDKTGAELGLISEADLSDALASRGIVPHKIYFDTTADWAAQTSLVSEENAIYVYTDYKSVDGYNIAGFKIGDGLAYVVDLPFTDTLYARHIEDTTIHITQTEREFWNNKNRAYVNLNNPENLILTNN